MFFDASAALALILSSDPHERAHFWIPDGEPESTSEVLLGTATNERMYIDTGEIVRVRVETDEFYDDEPGPPQIHEGIVQPREKRRAPYTIVVCFSEIDDIHVSQAQTSIAEQGLGPVAWWKTQEAELMNEA